MKQAGRFWPLVLVVAGLICLGMAGLAAAAPPTSPLTCPKLTAALTVDGSISEWAAISGVTLTANTAESVSGAPSGPADISALLRCAWDTQWLHFAVDVSDDILLADSTTIGDDDGVELALDGQRDRACCTSNDHQFTFAIDSRLADFGVSQAPSPLRWVVMPRLGGYVLEASIPMTMVLPGPPASGTLVGFNWGLNDDDDGGRRDKHLLWADSTILNFPLFGDLLLGGAVSTTPTATAQPTTPPALTATPTRTATVAPGATQTATPTAPATSTPTPTPTAPGTPDALQRVTALEGGLTDLAQLLGRIWAVMQTAGYLPGDVPPGGTPTATPTSRVLGYLQRVRCGGGAASDALGDIWAADQPYTPGSWGYVGGPAYETTQPIAGTLDDALYQAERYNMATYQFDLPSAVYRVQLRFAEIYQYAGPGQRVFDVSLEGTKVITGLDLFAAAGLYTAYDRTFDVSVLDGQLNIDFVATKGAAKISAIKVAAIGYVGPTPTPSLDQRVGNIETQMTDLELLLQQILLLFDRFLGL